MAKQRWLSVTQAGDIDVNKANNDGFTPLNVACKNGHTEVVEPYSSDADINKANNDEGDRYIASFNDKLKVVEVLLKAGADVNVRDKEVRRRYIRHPIMVIQRWLRIYSMLVRMSASGQHW